MPEIRVVSELDEVVVTVVAPQAAETEAEEAEEGIEAEEAAAEDTAAAEEAGEAEE